MKKYLLFTALAAFILSITFCTPSEKKGDNEVTETNNGVYPGYQSFPDGYGYLVDSTKLNKAVQQKDFPTVRDHGWKLFAGIMQQGEGITWPLWYTWPTGTQAFPPKYHGPTQETPVKSLIHKNQLNRTPAVKRVVADGNDPIMDTLHTPKYPIPVPVINMYAADSVFIYDTLGGVSGIIDGGHFASNGDIMIPTESFSNKGFNWITKSNLNKGSKLSKLQNDYLNKQGPHDLNTPPEQFVTKHMYWPILADQLSALPVWNNNYSPTYRGYAGYEEWKTIIAIDPSKSNNKAGETASVTYLYGVLDSEGNALPPVTKKDATVYNIDKFYHHQVTKEEWKNFDQREKAIINASSYWAYNKPFGPGDYLVTIACHMNTKEIPTWALQSVWWSDTPTEGKHALNRPKLPQAKGPWQHYKLTTAYGIPNSTGDLDPSFNPYIELVIHPVATNCNNCHRRAGWPESKTMASYQNPDCLNLLSYLQPDNPCFSDYLLTDFQWIIPDRANRSE